MLNKTLLIAWMLGAEYALADQVLITTNTIEQERSVFAIQITAENAESLIRSGPDAIGGVDDWFLTNGTLCAIVSDASHEGEFSDKGGSLVDLGFCGRADDHFSFTHDLLQGSRRRPLDANSIKLEQSDSSASILVTSSRDGAVLVTRYTLSGDQPTQINIDKRLSQDQKHPDVEDFSFYSTLNFNYHSLEPFVFASKQLENSNGFQNEDFVTRGNSAMTVAARNADTIITPSPPTAEHGISYGWHLASAERVTDSARYSLPSFVLADDSSNAMLILTDTFYIGDGSKLGWLQLPQLLLLSLDDDIIETKEVIYVGRRGDIASVTDQLLGEHPSINGKLSETNAAIHIFQSNGKPLTHIRPELDGTFKARLPIGDYRVHVKGSASRTLDVPIKIGEGRTDLGILELPSAATLTLPEGKAMRLVFVGINDTPDPDFANTLTGSTVTEEDGVHTLAPVSQVFLAGVAGDKTQVELAPGEYQVYATRGPEFTLEKTQITVTEGQQQTLKIKTPTRTLSTPNYIASDLHVHSGISFDNAFSDSERVRTFVAEFGEVMVSSEHDVPVDFAPKIEEMGVADKITSIAAAEVTSLLPTSMNPYTGGHANFFPYYPDPTAFRRGMINHENRRWRDIIHDIKQDQGEDTVVQLNHPRLNMKLSGETLPDNWDEIIDYGQFFDHMGTAGHPFNPRKPMHEHPNNVLIEADPKTGLRDIDFDLIEVINPGGEHHHDRIKAVRQDWLSLLKQGEKLVGTANSDSHRSDFQVAVPRTMVAMQDDRVTHFDQPEFIASLKTGNAYGTTGPMLEIALGDVGMGDMFTGARGTLSLTITKADWISIDRAEIQINGETVAEHQLIEAKEQTLRIPLVFSQDSFVTVEIHGPATPDYKAVYSELTPYAFSNPIYVDRDGDGKWMAPGLTQ